VITFDSVTKRFADGTVAVDDLSLDMPAGQITVLVGPSGCGKTTSLRMINRMIEPTSGRILLDGKDVLSVQAATLRRQIGYVIQQAGLFPHRTVAGNIATVPHLLGWSRGRARARAMELLERVGLPASFAGRYPYQLSGGQQQRVGVARALAADPPVMLMDEPFSAVDPVVRNNLQEEFLRLQQDLGKTIVFVTHDVDEAIKLGDRIAVLRTGGRLAQFAAPEELLAHPYDAFVADFLGADRGIRRLSFLVATGLRLTGDGVVAADATGAQAGRVAGEQGLLWLLAVDGDRRPLGWAEVARVPADGEVGESHLVPIGRTFRVGADSLRVALDSAVLSPAGLAVGVDEDGRLVGTASQAEVGDAARAASPVEPADPGHVVP
jgi:osmoprotectant transport system ATP-binding protein